MSPLRHSSYPPTKLVAWKCPSCAAENMGPLEQGCTSCHAGDPKQATAEPPASKLQHIDLTPVRDRVRAFVAWRVREHDRIPDDRDDALQFAFEAGVDWARTQAAPTTSTAPPEAAPTGGWHVQLIAPNGEDTEPLTAPAEATIVAALAFYLDNQLGYGAIPGQLTAAECRDLIEKLKEQEPSE